MDIKNKWEELDGKKFGKQTIKLRFPLSPIFMFQPHSSHFECRKFIMSFFKDVFACPKNINISVYTIKSSFSHTCIKVAAWNYLARAIWKFVKFILYFVLDEKLFFLCIYAYKWLSLINQIEKIYQGHFFWYEQFLWYEQFYW